MSPPPSSNSRGSMGSTERRTRREGVREGLPQRPKREENRFRMGDPRWGESFWEKFGRNLSFPPHSQFHHSARASREVCGFARKTGQHRARAEKRRGQ